MEGKRDKKTYSVNIDVSLLQLQQDIDLQDSFLNLEVLCTQKFKYCSPRHQRELFTL